MNLVTYICDRTSHKKCRGSHASVITQKTCKNDAVNAASLLQRNLVRIWASYEKLSVNTTVESHTNGLLSIEIDKYKTMFCTLHYTAQLHMLLYIPRVSEAHCGYTSLHKYVITICNRLLFSYFCLARL